MKPKPILTAIAVALAALVQPALAGFTRDANGNSTHHNGIPIPPMQTIAEARAATEKRLAAIKAEEAQQAAQAATELATRNPSQLRRSFSSPANPTSKRLGSIFSSSGTTTRSLLGGPPPIRVGFRMGRITTSTVMRHLVVSTPTGWRGAIWTF
jgi:hypothetical protein